MDIDKLSDRDKSILLYRVTKQDSPKRGTLYSTDHLARARRVLNWAYDEFKPYSQSPAYVELIQIDLRWQMGDDTAQRDWLDKIAWMVTRAGLIGPGGVAE